MSALLTCLIRTQTSLWRSNGTLPLMNMSAYRVYPAASPRTVIISPPGSFARSGRNASLCPHRRLAQSTNIPRLLNSPVEFTMVRSESTQDDISPSAGTRAAFPPPPDHDRPDLVSPPARRPHRQRQKIASSQTAMFRAAAPPLVFAVLVTGLLVELRARLAPPPPTPGGGGTTVAVLGNSIAQRALIWAEVRWPGLWGLPVVCAAAVCALRAAIWAAAAVVDSIEEWWVARGAAAGVRVGRWEDGGTVSGGDLLGGMFT
ncbi:hypothetical protein EDB89DRAFT_2004009 [Lactarius sanguifluus]|nr:hypothetical protein EDB89DRAFT_2004009 [Lactarius sanguifluus]